jgi:hypothetical protein
VRRTLVVVVSLLAAGSLVAVTQIATAHTSQRNRAACGVERWSVKTLTDPAAGAVNFKAKATTIRGLRRRKPPASLGPTRNPGVERNTYRVRANLVEMNS